MNEIKSVVTELYSRPQVQSGKNLPTSGNESPQRKDETNKVENSLQSERVDPNQKVESNKTNENERESVKEAVAKLNDYVQNMERKLEFAMDDDSGLTVIKVYDKESDEMIRQLPSEEALTLARNLNKSEPLVLFSAQV